MTRITFAFVLMVGCSSRDQLPILDSGADSPRAVDAGVDAALDAEDASVGSDAEPPILDGGPSGEAPRILLEAGDCPSAELFEAGANFIAPSEGGSAFARVRIPPRSAVGFVVADDWEPASVCRSCDFARGSFNACTNDEIQPNRLFNGDYIATGRPLVVNESDEDTDVVIQVASTRGGGGMSTYLFPLQSPEPESMPCEPAPVTTASAWTRTPSCGFSMLVPGEKAALLFGIPLSMNVENAGEFAEVLGPLSSDGSSVAATLIPFEGGRCEAPMPMGPGTLMLRADLGGARPSELCPVLTHLGSRYLEIDVPANMRARVIASSAFIADGGGYAVLALAEACGAMECEQTSEQAWEDQAPPTRLEILNPTDGPLRRIIAVHQGAVGYPANTITLDLSFEAI